MAMSTRTSQGATPKAGGIQHASPTDQSQTFLRFSFPDFPVLPPPPVTQFAIRPAVASGASLSPTLATSQSQHIADPSPFRGNIGNVWPQVTKPFEATHTAPAPIFPSHGSPQGVPDIARYPVNGAIPHVFPGGFGGPVRPPGFQFSYGLPNAAPSAVNGQSAYSLPHSPPAVPIGMFRNDTPFSSPTQAHGIPQSQIAQKFSRLPPEGVARKTPRKSGGVQPERRLSDTTRLKKEARGRAASKQGNQSRAKSRVNEVIDYEVEDEEDTPKRAKQTLRGRTPRPRNGSVQSARGQVVVLDEDDSDDATMHDAWASVESMVPGDELQPTLRRRGRPPKTQQVRPSVPLEDIISPELRAIQMALGRDNWKDYVEALERRYKDQITEAEFGRTTKAIFMIVDGKIRRKMDKLVEEEFVKPNVARMGEEEEREIAIESIE